MLTFQIYHLLWSKLEIYYSILEYKQQQLLAIISNQCKGDTLATIAEAFGSIGYDALAFLQWATINMNDPNIDIRSEYNNYGMYLIDQLLQERATATVKPTQIPALYNSIPAHLKSRFSKMNGP